MNKGTRRDAQLVPAIVSLNWTSYDKLLIHFTGILLMFQNNFCMQLISSVWILLIVKTDLEFFRNTQLSINACRVYNVTFISYTRVFLLKYFYILFLSLKNSYLDSTYFNCDVYIYSKIFTKALTKLSVSF